MMLRDRDNLNLVERGGGEITCNQSDREEKQQGRRRRRMDGREKKNLLVPYSRFKDIITIFYIFIVH